MLGRDQREASVIPTEEAEAWTRLTCEADAVWHKAKTANDWASFEPYVDRIVAQLKHQAELMDPKRDPCTMLARPVRVRGFRQELRCVLR